MENELALFDPVKLAAENVRLELVGFIITDRPTRDLLFEKCRDADRAIKAVDAKRLELIRPISADKKALKLKYEKDLKPMKSDELKIGEYAKDKLIQPLSLAIMKKKQEIMAFDDTERKRIAAEEKKKSEELAALEKEKEEKTENLTGIQKVQARQEVEEKIETTQMAFSHSSAPLKRSGREKTVYSWSLVDINLVPDKYIVKTVDRKAVEADLETVESIPGLKITSEKKMMYV